MHEAFQRLRFDTFMDSFDVNEQEKIRTFVESMGDGFPTQQYKDKLSSQEFETICDKYESFVEETSQKSKTFAFWSIYLNPICTGGAHNERTPINIYPSFLNK
jgi:hypothetical protein